MKFKDLIVPIFFALTITVASNYFFVTRTPIQEDLKDITFKAQVSQEASEPLDYSINFEKSISSKNSTDESLEYVETNVARWGFSKTKGTIDSLVYKREAEYSTGDITVLKDNPNKTISTGTVLFDEKNPAPSEFKLVKITSNQDSQEIIFESVNSINNVEKIYKIYNNNFNVDLNIKFKVDSRAKIYLSSPDESGLGETFNAITFAKNKFIKNPIEKVANTGTISPTFLGIDSKYFVTILLANKNDAAKNDSIARGYFSNDSIILQSKKGSNQENTSVDLSFYFGPKEQSFFDKIDKRLNGILNYGILAFISSILLKSLKFFYKFLKNYGYAIIALTVLIKIVTAPLVFYSEKNRKKQMEAQKKLQYIEQKYKNDPEQLAIQKAEFAKKHGVSGILGCLPLFLQIPIFIALSRVLSSAIELHNAPFVLWITDLSQKDPYYILPALVGITMFFQTTTTSHSYDPKQKLFSLFLALVIGAAMANAAAGLCLYFFLSTALGLIQNYIQTAMKA